MRIFHAKLLACNHTQFFLHTETHVTMDHETSYKGTFLEIEI